MKAGVLCLLLLSACSLIAHSEEPPTHEYTLIWYCVSPEGCERTEEVTRIDYAILTDYFYFHFTSTNDDSFGADAQYIVADSPGSHCSLLHFLTLFEHELEPSKFCFTPTGFEFELTIPNADPATQSKWVVAGRDRVRL